MALISCPECSSQISDRAVSCPHCGCPIAKPPAEPKQWSPAPSHWSQAPAAPAQSALVTVQKSRGVFIILGLLFGVLGLHNFYAGYNGRGATKLALAVIGFIMDASTGFYSGFFYLAAGIDGLWTLIELFTTKEDGAGHRMA